jgi:hypothetical protein
MTKYSGIAQKFWGKMYPILNWELIKDIWISQDSSGKIKCRSRYLQKTEFYWKNYECVLEELGWSLRVFGLLKQITMDWMVYKEQKFILLQFQRLGSPDQSASRFIVLWVLTLVIHRWCLLPTYLHGCRSKAALWNLFGESTHSNHLGRALIT